MNMLTPSSLPIDAPFPLRSRWTWALLALAIAAVLVRGVSVYGFTYPTGPDYGLHLLYAQQTFSDGAPPAFARNYQLGQATWPLLPGGPLLFGAAAAVSGGNAFDLVPLVLIFAPIEVIGMALLGMRLFRRTDAALLCAAISTALPLFVDMMTWAGYPNLIAVSLFPIALTVWLHNWDHPSPRWLLLTTVLLCGMAYIHHLSTLWLALTIAMFCAWQVVRAPRHALRRIIPIALTCALVGLPIALNALALTTQQDAAATLTTGDRFDTTRVTWEIWARIMTPMSLALAAGFPFFLRDRRIDPAGKALVVALALLTVIFLFGWLIGLRFYYTRALYFLSIPIACGGAAFILAWPRRAVRLSLAALIIGSIGISAIVRARDASAWFEIVTPDLIEAVEWLDNYSTPGDVVVTGTFLGFQIPRLLDRPQLAALTPDLISNREIFPLAADATAIMMGLDDMDSALAEHRVRFVIVRTRTPDIPDPDRSRRVMDAHPRLRLVFRNADVLIYEVRG